MSMYALVHGQNPAGPVLVEVVRLRAPVDPGRYRDAFVEIEGDRPVIRIHTRNGGGNRECYCEERDIVETGHHCQQAAIRSMQEHPWYLRDQDDSFDFTYADFYFGVDLAYLAQHGEEGQFVARAVVGMAQPPVDMHKRWMDAIEALKGGSDDSGSTDARDEW